MNNRNPLIVTPIQAPVKYETFNLEEVFLSALSTANQELEDGDIIAISSKYVSISEGRVVSFGDITVSDRAKELAAQFKMVPEMTELIVQEADHILGGIPGFLLTQKDGIISPNAGIDRSNVPAGMAVLFPVDPFLSAFAFRTSIKRALGKQVGVIITDSWLVPGRWGTTGIALSMSGFAPLQDERGKPDLFQNVMQATQRGVADSLSVAAQCVMGERDEATPFAIIRNSGVPLVDQDAPLSVKEIGIPWQDCLYIGSLTKGLISLS
jgi:coenzyme F420-0:L-glutamate ligase / coenzyme F420-1:gamma-L-glutamate ligase